MNTVPSNGIQLYKPCHYPFSFTMFFPHLIHHIHFKICNKWRRLHVGNSLLHYSVLVQPQNYSPKVQTRIIPLGAFQVFVYFSMEVCDIPLLLETLLLIFWLLEKKEWEMLSLPVEQLAWTYHFRSTRSPLLQGICAVSCTNMISCSNIANKLGHSI